MDPVKEFAEAYENASPAAQRLLEKRQEHGIRRECSADYREWAGLGVATALVTAILVLAAYGFSKNNEYAFGASGIILGGVGSKLIDKLLGKAKEPAEKKDE